MVHKDLLGLREAGTVLSYTASQWAGTNSSPELWPPKPTVQTAWRHCPRGWAYYPSAPASKVWLRPGVTGVRYPEAVSASSDAGRDGGTGLGQEAGAETVLT